MEKRPIGRFAPTPSGRMHLGNVFAALIAWLSVRSRDGEMVLRMEDLDTQRTSAEFAQVLREDLAWLGLDYDRETPPQSQRTEVYDEAFRILEEKGLISSEGADSGMFHTVDNERADWSVNQSYWALYLDGAYAMAGIYDTVVENGAVYKLVYTIG